MLRIELFSTEHCTLCDEALELLLGMPEVAGQELLVVDVAADDDLLKRYGERIPVLCVLGQELQAPLTRQRILSWLDELVR